LGVLGGIIYICIRQRLRRCSAKSKHKQIIAQKEY
jgi:hypothetical protein